MADSHVNECLSSVDAFFLYLEQPGAPLNVASISVFDGLIALDECTQHIESRLSMLPRFTQRVAPAAFGLGLPTWQSDPDFDIKNHVRERTLQHGTEAEYKSAVSELLSSHLDRNRPLWEITLFHGLSENHTGVVVRTHHCLIDGIAGVGMLKALLDSTPIPSPEPKKKHRVEPPPPPPDPGTALLDGLISSCFTAAQALLTAHSELLRMAEHAAAPKAKEPGTETQPEGDKKSQGGLAQLGDLGRALSELAQPTQRLSYNLMCHGPQIFEWLKIPMEEISAVKVACGGTVNDVVLTTLTSTLQRYAELHDTQLNGRTLRLVIPVNLRGVSEASDMGNHITFLPVDIPFGVQEPQKLIATIQKRVEASRTAHAAELVGLITTLLGAVPSSLQSLFGTILSQLPISLCNSICTNVHGPRTPLYLLGHKMLSSYPYVPIGGEMGMNCAVLSYDGTLFVGFTGDARAIPDLARLPGYFQDSFTALKKAVGVDLPKPKPSRPKRKVMPKKRASVTQPSRAAVGIIPTAAKSHAVEVPEVAMAEQGVGS